MHAWLAYAACCRFGIIDDLQLGDILGRGAFGRVYKGGQTWGRSALPCVTQCSAWHQAAAARVASATPAAAVQLNGCAPHAPLASHHRLLRVPTFIKTAGRWKGAIVAVKIIEHRVQQGKTYDLSREPLLRWGWAPLVATSLDGQLETVGIQSQLACTCGDWQLVLAACRGSVPAA